MTISPALFPAVTVTVVRDRKIRTALRTNQIAGFVTVPSWKKIIGDIGDLLSERHALEKSKNRKILLTILSNIQYLAGHALPLRGDWNTETMSEANSNFHQLLKLRAQENPEIIEWLQKRDDKYKSAAIQNKMLESMTLIRQISANIQNAPFFTIMADETADFSNKEQLVICIALGICIS